LQPDRCHRITVAGWTTETAAAQPRHRWDSRTQSRRSQVRNRGRGAVRWRTASWCRKARFSNTRALAGPEHAEEAGEDEGNHAGHHRSDRPKVNADKADGVSGRHRTATTQVRPVDGYVVDDPISGTRARQVWKAEDRRLVQVRWATRRARCVRAASLEADFFLGGSGRSRLTGLSVIGCP
jgi:hypothetical protein